MKTRLIIISLVLCLASAGAPPYHVYLPFVARGIEMAIGYEIITADNVTVDLTIAGINVNPGIPDGFGLPPITHIAKTVYGLPGGVLDSININSRVVTLTCSMTAQSQEALHAVRKILWSPLRWNRTAAKPPAPARLRYTANSKSVDLYVHYLADVTGNAGSANNLQLVGIRLIAYDPIWYDDAAASAGLLISYVPAVSGIAGKIDGAWTSMGGGIDQIAFGGRVSALAYEPATGDIIIGGYFTTAGGVAASMIARWDSSASVFVAMGSGFNQQVSAIAVAPNGDIYAAGVFTALGDTTPMLAISRWDGVAWNAVGGGITGGAHWVYALEISSTGLVYAGGEFTTSGGVATAELAVWNGTVWAEVGGGADNTVYAIAIDTADNVVVGGLFTALGGVAHAYAAKWDGSAWTTLGALNGRVRALEFGLNGMLYSGGFFTVADTKTVNYVAQWNGYVWDAMGTGMNEKVYSIDVSNDGLVFVGGLFTIASGVVLGDRFAVWNGSAWNQLDIDLPGAPIGYSVLAVDDLYFGFDTAGTASVSGATPITNSGTFDARPVFAVTGPGTLSWIENVTTGKTMIFNCYLNAGETATITPKLATFASDWRGDLLPYAALLPQSDFGDFALAPAPIAPAGVNSIAVMMTGTTPVVQNDNAGTAGAAQLDDWENITGVDCDNTASGGRMYVKIIDDTGGYFHVALYDAAAMAAGDLVGHTATYNSTGAKAIVADNASGLGGTITVDEVLAADADIIVFFATVCESHYDAYLTADDGV